MKDYIRISMILTSVYGRCGRVGNVVCSGEQGDSPGRSDDRDSQPLGKASPLPSLLVSGTATFLHKELRCTLHGAGGRGIHHRYAIWRVRRWLQHKPDTDPPYMLIDSIRHSVFCTGPKLKVVENPAMRQAVPQP